MHCCTRPSASGNSASGHPQHLVGDSFDYCTERYEIVVYLIPVSHLDFSIISFQFVYMKMKVEFLVFRDQPHFRIFGRIATFSILSCKKMLFIDDQTFPDIQKQHFTK